MKTLNKNNMKNLQEKTFDLLEATNLNWSIRKEQLYTKSGSEASAWGLIKNGDDAYLGTVGKQYTPYQNYQMAEALIEACDGIDLTLTRGGMLANGKKVYLQAGLPDEFIGKSAMKRYITGLNSHDGTTSIGFGSSNTVVICQNTYYRALSELSRFRHTTNAEDSIKTFLEGMRQALVLEGALITKMKIMADLPLKEELFASILDKCFDVDINAKASEVSSRKKNILTAVANDIETELKLEGSTLWGLFNGITRYTNHTAVKPDKKEEYIMTGRGYEISNIAFNEIMSWIEANTDALTPELV